MGWDGWIVSPIAWKRNERGNIINCIHLHGWLYGMHIVSGGSKNERIPKIRGVVTMCCSGE